MERTIATRSAGLRPQSIDLAQESFTVYVPVNHPPEGYGLLTFIPPWQIAKVPEGWESVLDQLGVIFVSASKSGNEENVLDRRIPLALLGANGVLQHYPINKERVYIGGFSGGSRVALRVALAYADLFHGVVLNAGSDSIGNELAVLPPDEIFRQFQTSTRLVYVTGARDDWNISHDVNSRASMDGWCVFGASVDTMPRSGHEVADPSSLHRALIALEQRPPINNDKVSACNARIAKGLAAKLQHIRELLDEGKTQDAWRSLKEIDVLYGGLAAAQIIDLERGIGARR